MWYHISLPEAKQPLSNSQAIATEFATELVHNVCFRLFTRLQLQNTNKLRQALLTSGNGKNQSLL